MYSKNAFTITIEVVPPESTDAGPLLTALKKLSAFEFEGFSVATNPLAKPCMSALAICALLQQQIGKPAVLHCTPRDHNRLGLFSLLSGAKAFGLKSILAATGDHVALKDRANTRAVYDLNVFELIEMALKVGLNTGVVLDPNPGSPGFSKAVGRLENKVAAGAQFIVTQPVYDKAGAMVLADAVGHLDVPLIMGILPLRTSRHAEFLHHKVAGITVPNAVRQQMATASDEVSQGIQNASEMLAVAKDLFSGACIMPPFNHYEIMGDILS